MTYLHDDPFTARFKEETGGKYPSQSIGFQVISTTILHNALKEQPPILLLNRCLVLYGRT
ncbi:hypothetical protein [Photorhabdus luminescens]|uniref:hypothetical protein n=1 Tax=Photorhabdus luminescens TaxID=29488 RepID=UPI00223EFB66|nr:hypothetical protein [Photorhabdus luminescens]MCW7763404.1 hypothetical protein [Photorhabdus luminescens subsp. venezuelensis]